MIQSIIGIDPGKQGGICALQGSKLLFVKRAPRLKIENTVKYLFDKNKMVEIMSSVKDLNPIVYIEKVHSYPKQGVRSMFNFGEGYGIWQGISAALGYEIVFVRPQEWKSKVIQETNRDKQASIDMALRMFPDADLKPGRCYKEHDGMAEAILIAVYGGMQEWGFENDK